ncbi:MAG: HAMP domain-containing histidine kinase, partial [Cyclobacteriaceae bacterium]|nr:HAMP domain-containing histidine kinase [Cyclobacteriaceae bacterium]
YKALHLLLRRIKEVNQLETPLYTIVFFPTDSTFRFIVTSSDKPYYRHAYTNYPKALLSNWETGGTLDSYRDENGQWLSAFAPVRNSAGKVVALLEADENFEAFAMRARNELWRNTLLSTLLVIPFGLLLFNYFARTFKKQEEDQQLLLQQKEEIESQNEEIKAQSDLIEEQNRDLEKRVQERTAELQTTNEQLANFLYHSSHDVQAPIATLKGLYHLISLEFTTETGKEYLKRIQQTTYRLEQMVKTIQRVHYIKTKSPDFQWIDIQELAQQVFQRFEKRNADLQFVSNNNKIVFADEELLQVILEELIKNALQFNERRANLTIAIEVWQKNGMHHVSVRNNGDKLSHTARENLFVMFQRNHQNSEGMGLGLYISSVCAQRMNGDLRLNEEHQDGVAFEIQLPVTD